jgi:hypothetical protein
MLYIRKQMTSKRHILFVLLTLSIITVQLNATTSSTSIQTEALFLGCGIQDYPGPCNDAGFRVVRHQVKVFGISVGNSWSTEELCDAGSGVGNPNLNG